MIWVALFTLIVFAAPIKIEAAARFMSENGATSGTCSTSGTACRFDYLVVSALNCGDTVTILNGDGTYTGANNMLNTSGTFGGTTPTNRTCSSGSQITFSAETDGGVFFDGQFSRAPFIAEGLTYWNFSGFDAGNADAAGTNFALAMSTLSHVTMSRICVSNTQKRQPSDNTHVIGYYGTVSDTTMEDICAFGTGRNTFVDGSAGTGNIFRRFWVRFEGWCPNSGGDTGAMSVQAPYYSDVSSPTGGNNILENFIIIYDPEQFDQSPSCSSWSASGSPIPGSFVRTTSLTNQHKGWIMYGYDGFTTTARTATTTAWLNDTQASLGYTRNWADIFIDRRSQPDAVNGRAFSMNCTSNCSGNTADRLTSIRNSANPASFFNGFTVTNQNECTSTSACPNFYTGDGSGTGSRACFQYSGGTLTSTPLWPWSMDDRIKAALARANTAGTGGSALSGTAGSGYAANTVTSEIVSRYGSIPTACLSSSVFTPSFPVASDFPSVSVRDDFDRANAPTLGSSWTELLSDTFSIVSNAAAAPSTGGAFARALYTDTKLQTSHEVYATWTTLAEPGGYATFLSFAGTDLTANNQYRVVINQTSGSNTLLKVQRVDGGGTATDILSAVDLGIEAVDGNSFGVRVSGTTISLYWKWTDGIWYRVGQFTDSNLSSLPSTGVYGGIAGGSPSVINNFGAGPFVDQPAQDPPTPPASVGAGRFGTTFPGVR